MDDLNNPILTDDTQTESAEEQAPHEEQASPAEEKKAEHTQEPTPATSGSRWSKLGKNILVFASLALILIVAYCVVNLDRITLVIQQMGDIIAPLIIGAIIAYLCNPILVFYEYRVFRRLKNGGLRRGLSLLFTVLTAIAAIALLLLMIVPKLIESIADLVSNYQLYADNLLSGLTGTLSSLAEKNGWDIDIGAIEEKLHSFLGSGENLFNSIMKLINTEENPSSIPVGAIMDIVTIFKNWILGIFIAFYILASKEKRVAQVKKFRRALFTKKQDDRIAEVVTLADRTFSGYVFGILIDALVVGIMTFVLLSIFKVSPKYNLLISAICAATNIIPVFGPFIGAIPSALIVLISNPSKFFLFIFLVLVIQQIDGNLLCPKIQGDNTGVSSLAVLIAITIAGNIGGILGMIIGVPIFAVIIELFKRFLDVKLEKKGEPVDTTEYYPHDALGNAEKDVYYEHASLRYEYEHSKLKSRFDRFKRRLFKSSRKDKKAEKKDQCPPSDAPENNPPSEDAPQ